MLGENEARRLREALHEHIDAARDLLDALARERAALTTRDTPALEAAVQDKHGLIARLHDLERERTTVMSPGASPRPAEMRWPADLETPLNELVELSRRCRRDNEINGALLEACRRRTEQALALLAGHPLDDHATYGPRRPDSPAGMRVRTRA